nr:MAG TPA: hypothetical protein [Caudoviricetes sp.]
MLLDLRKQNNIQICIYCENKNNTCILLENIVKCRCEIRY